MELKLERYRNALLRTRRIIRAQFGPHRMILVNEMTFKLNSHPLAALSVPLNLSAHARSYKFNFLQFVHRLL